MGDELDLRHEADPDAACDRQPHRLAATDLHHRIDLDLVPLQHVLEGEARRGTAFAHDHTLALQFVDPDILPFREAVPGVHEDHDLVAAVGHGENPVVVFHMGQDGDVGGIVE